MRAGRTVSLSWTARLLVGVAVVLMSSERAEGCQCAATSPCQALSSADAIFVGLVSDISPVYTADGHSISGAVVTVAVERNFIDALGIVVLKQNHSSCNVPFRLGQRYLVYARRGSDGSLATSECSGTKLLAEADDDLAFLTSLPPAGTGGSVTGSVERVQIDLLGVRRDEKLTAAASGVSLTISGADRFQRSLFTDREGRFRASGLPPGEYSIAVNVPQTIRVNGELRVRLADRGCAITAIQLIANGHVEGRVLDHAGEPVARAFVSLMPAAYTNEKEFPRAWVRQKSSGPQGEFAFDGLPAGEYHVGVNVRFGARPDAPYEPVWLPNVTARSQTMPVRIADGERRSDLEIVVGARLREVMIEGVVLKPDGSPADGANVVLLAPGTRLATTSGKTDAYGVFSLKGLERTQYDVEASVDAPPGRRISAVATVTITGDDPVRLRLSLSPVQTLRNSPR